MIFASLDLCFPRILRTSRALPGWMASLLHRDAQVLSAVRNVVTPRRHLSCARRSLGIVISALFERSPILLTDLQESSDSQPLPIAPRKSEPLREIGRASCRERVKVTVGAV